ncbi:MAG: glycosyltransferase family 9 protein [Streptosporangiaceae bacterium]|nr:glycosyltransferase family 9 protein [Streptosporangiaceae bacterium]
MTAAKPRVVVLRALGLGDLLTAIPALRGLRAAFGQARVTLAAPAVLAPLAALSGAVDDVTDTGALYVGGVWARRQERLNGQGRPPGAAEPLDRALHGADVAVNLHGRGPQSSRLLLATAPWRLIAFEHRDVPATRGLPRWHADEHEVARWCRLLAETGIPADPGALGLPRPPVPSPRPGAVIIHPGAASAARRWPPSRWAEVARALASSAGPGRLVVTGTAQERPLARRVADLAGLDAGGVLAGRTGLLELAALTADAALVLSGDTGMAHLAAAYARPAVTLAGPVAPRLWGPPPRPWHRVLWAGRDGDPHADQPDPGLLALSTAEVIAAARAVLDATSCLAAARGRKAWG